MGGVRTALFVAAALAAAFLCSCGRRSREPAPPASPAVGRAASEGAAESPSVGPAAEAGGSVEDSGGFFRSEGLSYPARIVRIDDGSYPTAEEKRAAFVNAAASGSPDSPKLNGDAAIILLSGVVDLGCGGESPPVCDVGSNKVILGGGSATVSGTLRVKARPTNSSRNVIVRSVAFVSGGISVDGSYARGEGSSEFVPENVWVDRCSFSGGSLGVGAALGITVSLCEFAGGASVRVGSAGRTEADERRVTLRNCRFSGGAAGGSARVSATACKLHLFANDFSASVGTSVEAVSGALVVAEGNLFPRRRGSPLVSDGSSRVFASGNSAALPNSGSSRPFDVPYGPPPG